MATTDQLIAEHIADTNNPHNLTPASFGLEGVQNYPIATASEAFEAVVEERYLTPARLKDVFDGILRREGLVDENGNVIY